MPEFCNLGRTDRMLRIVIGFVLAATGIGIRDHLYAAIPLGLTGLVILIEGALGH